MLVSQFHLLPRHLNLFRLPHRSVRPLLFLRVLVRARACQLRLLFRHRLQFLKARVNRRRHQHRKVQALHPLFHNRLVCRRLRVQVRALVPQRLNQHLHQLAQAQVPQPQFHRAQVSRLHSQSPPAVHPLLQFLKVQVSRLHKAQALRLLFLSQLQCRLRKVPAPVRARVLVHPPLSRKAQVSRRRPRRPPRLQFLPARAQVLQPQFRRALVSRHLCRRRPQLQIRHQKV